MKSRLHWGLLFVVAVLVLLTGPARVGSQTPVPLKNAGFEGPPRHTQGEGTSVSSWLATDWYPWSVLGDSTYNREVEYKLITLETGRTPDLENHVHGGNHAQQFFTNGGTHTAGFYQRAQVPANSLVTFTIWAQIQTGQELLFVDGKYISDLRKGGGNYFVQVGVDPTGATPAHFGASLPATVQWTDPTWDVSAWGTDAKGNYNDLWVPLSLTVKAQGEWVTVYARGQCKFPTHYNTSFWDDASLTVAQPPTPTPAPPTPTRVKVVVPTNTPLPTETPTIAATATLTPTHTPLPTNTPLPTHTALPTHTPPPTHTPTPAGTPTPTIIAQVARPTATPTPVVYVAPTAPPVPAASGFFSQWAGLIVVIVAIFAAMGLGLFLGIRLAKR